MSELTKQKELAFLRKRDTLLNAIRLLATSTWEEDFEESPRSVILELNKMARTIDQKLSRQKKPKRKSQKN